MLCCSHSIITQPFTWFFQEREEAEALWAADGQGVAKATEDGEAKGTSGRSGRSQTPKEKSRGRGRVTGGKDEL